MEKLNMETLRTACHGPMSELDLKLVDDILRHHNAYPAMHEALKKIDADLAGRDYDPEDSIRAIARAALAEAGEP
jgi:hypothetical protein